MKGKPLSRDYLERLYSRYNRLEFVHPDPLEFLHNYKDMADREIVGIIASSLAYGRVAQILVSVNDVLKRIGSPLEYLHGSDFAKMKRDMTGFKHRFTTSDEMASLLFALKCIYEKYGSLYSCMRSKLGEEEDIIAALGRFVDEIRGHSPETIKSLLPHPKDGSACKRLCLFLRWMIRCDEVDPGGWNEIPKSKLIVPLDTHMHRIGRDLGLTSRKQADMKTAIEITRAFKKIFPEDPVRYDFVLTRFGIRNDMGSLLPEGV